MTITRNLILLVLLSFVVTFWSGVAAQFIDFLRHAFATASGWLSINIGGYEMGETARHTFALVVIPLLISLAVALLLWIMKKESSSMMSSILWCVWLVLATMLLAQ